MNTDILSPTKILRDAIRAVPAVKYALGIAGIVSVIALISSFGLDLRVAGLASIVMILLMTLLVIFAKLTTTASKHFLRPVLILMWGSLLLTLASAILFFTAVFFEWPASPRRLFGLDAGENLIIEQSKSEDDIQQLRREMLYVATEHHKRLANEYDAGYAIFGVTGDLIVVPYDTTVRLPKIDWSATRVRSDGDTLHIIIGNMQLSCGVWLNYIGLTRLNGHAGQKSHTAFNNFEFFTENPRIGPYGRVLVVGMKDIMEKLPPDWQKEFEAKVAEDCAREDSVAFSSHAATVVAGAQGRLSGVRRGRRAPQDARHLHDGRRSHERGHHGFYRATKSSG